MTYGVLIVICARAPTTKSPSEIKVFIVSLSLVRGTTTGGRAAWKKKLVVPRIYFIMIYHPSSVFIYITKHATPSYVSRIQYTCGTEPPSASAQILRVSLQSPFFLFFALNNARCSINVQRPSWS